MDHFFFSLYNFNVISIDYLFNHDDDEVWIHFEKEPQNTNACRRPPHPLHLYRKNILIYLFTK